MHRSLLAGPAVLLATLGLAACTTQTQKCSNGVCDIDLSGVGANVELGGDDGSTLTLKGASGSTAEVTIDGETVTLTKGEPVSLSNATLELVTVEGEDDVQIKVRGAEAGSGAGGGASDDQ